MCPYNPPSCSSLICTTRHILVSDIGSPEKLSKFRFVRPAYKYSDLVVLG